MGAIGYTDHSRSLGNNPKTPANAHFSGWINRRATPAMLAAGATTERSQDLFMTWHAAGLRRLDGIIWALVAAVAGLDLMAAVFGGFSLALGTYAIPAGTCLL